MGRLPRSHLDKNGVGGAGFIHHHLDLLIGSAETKPGQEGGLLLGVLWVWGGGRLQTPAAPPRPCTTEARGPSLYAHFCPPPPTSCTYEPLYVWCVHQSKVTELTGARGHPERR